MSKSSRSTPASRALTISALAKKLKRDQPSVVTIVGREDLLRREARDLILAHAPGGAPDPDQVVTVSQETKPDGSRLQGIFDDLRTPDLFGGIPVVILDGAERWFKTEPDLWLDFLQQPPGHYILILIADQIDGRSKFAKALKATGWWISADRPYHRPPPWKPQARPWEHDLNQWVVHRFQQQQLQIDPRNAQLLIDRLGPLMAPLAQVVEKISVICNANKVREVTEELLLKQLPTGGDGNTFELIDRWFENDKGAALKVLRKMLESGWLDEKDQRVNNPQGLLLQFSALALKRARELRSVRKIVEKGGGEKEILEQTTLARPFLPRIRIQYRHCDEDRIQRMISTLIEIDWQMKSGAGPNPQELMERAILTA